MRRKIWQDKVWIPHRFGDASRSGRRYPGRHARNGRGYYHRKTQAMNASRLQRQKHRGVAPSPQGHKGLKKGVYVVPSLFTAMNILAGFYSLMATMSGFKLLRSEEHTS